MRVVIAGGINFNDYEMLCEKVSELLEGRDHITIISGHARGADSLGERYAKEHGMDLYVIEAEWKKYGKAAGPIRNRKMLQYAMEDEPMLIAFWNGTSRGTWNTISTAKKMGIETHVFPYTKE